MELNIAIVDDRTEDIDIVILMARQYLQNNQNLKINFSKFCSGEIFFHQLAGNNYHAIFVDICMEGMNGIELSRRLRLLDSNISIIFMSTTTEYVFETFQATPFGYLIKPYSFEQFSELMDKIFHHYSAITKSVLVKIPHSEISIETDTICRVLSCGHNTELKTSSGNVLRSIDSLNYFQKKLLGEENFIECNRGIIINMDYVLTVKDGDIVMQDGSHYPMRIRNKKELTTKITKYLSQKLKGGMYL